MPKKHKENKHEKAFGECIDGLIDIAIKKKDIPMNKFPGVYEFILGPSWKVVCNGHKETKKWKDIDIPPFNFYAEFNGWPAGFFTPIDGCLAAGEAGNVFSLRDEIMDALGKLNNA